MNMAKGVKKPKNFWLELPRPFFVLAPMANVTDCVFRKVIAKYGKPDVMWTEFVSANGLVSDGKRRLMIDLKYSPKERPIVAQLFTGHPEAMKKTAMLVKELKFDGLDINMGCPDRSVEKQGGGAAMIKSYKNAVAVIEAAREGVIIEQRAKSKEQKLGMPVSVKTRLGYNKVDFEWIRMLLEQKLPALTVHLRTRKEMSEVPAHWELMPEIVKLRNEISPETLIIGNGDVETLSDAASKCKQYGCDGVMIGRGIFGTPWFFEDASKIRYGRNVVRKPRTPEERLGILLEHTKLFEKTFKGIKNFATMKKHFKAYVSGWPADVGREGAKELRVRLMVTRNAKDVKKIINEYIRKA